MTAVSPGVLILLGTALAVAAVFVLGALGVLPIATMDEPRDPWWRARRERRRRTAVQSGFAGRSADGPVGSHRADSEEDRAMMSEAADAEAADAEAPGKDEPDAETEPDAAPDEVSGPPAASAGTDPAAPEGPRTSG
ncbi:hypothetical protein [Brachybacterium nesterenkovii]|uniref:hypothetical protein n=1 Tax=Brachybacterium nesterenkovii TaxID=47847 RepID=UPI00321A5CFE